MAEDRSLPYGSPLPAAWLAALQEFVGSAAINFRLSLANPTTVQVVAGPNSGQVGLGIDGLFRYITSTVTAGIAGGALNYDIFAVTGPNNFVPNPGGSPPETDSTNYGFSLEVLAVGSTPPLAGGVTNFRKIGSLSWDGTKITSLVPLVGTVDGSGGFDIGDLKASACGTPGLNWLLCDGSTFNRSQYEILYSRIGTSYGTGDGTSGSASLPNFVGRVIVGAGLSTAPGATTLALGTSGGEQTHAQTTSELAQHGHTAEVGHAAISVIARTSDITVVDLGHVHGGPSGYAIVGSFSGVTLRNEVSTAGGIGHFTGNGPVTTGNTSNASGEIRVTDPGHTHPANDTGHTHVIDQAGSGTPMSLMQPYGTANVFIKVA